MSIYIILMINLRRKAINRKNYHQMDLSKGDVIIVLATSLWYYLVFNSLKNKNRCNPLIKGVQKLSENISTHLLTVAADFCLTLTDAVEP